MQGGPHDGEGYEITGEPEYVQFAVTSEASDLKTDRYWRSIAMGTDAENIVYWIYEYEGRF